MAAGSYLPNMEDLEIYLLFQQMAVGRIRTLPNSSYGKNYEE